MDKFEKQLLSFDKKNVNDKRMDILNRESSNYMREDTKYFKEYKEKLINLRF